MVHTCRPYCVQALHGPGGGRRISDGYLDGRYRRHEDVLQSQVSLDTVHCACICVQGAPTRKDAANV
jgi:hypothetical protein